MFKEITKDNWLLFAQSNYDNPTLEKDIEFYDDIKRFKYLKRLFRRLIFRFEVFSQTEPEISNFGWVTRFSVKFIFEFEHLFWFKTYFLIEINSKFNFLKSMLEHFMFSLNWFLYSIMALIVLLVSLEYRLYFNCVMFPLIVLKNNFFTLISKYWYSDKSPSTITF